MCFVALCPSGGRLCARRPLPIRVHYLNLSANIHGTHFGRFSPMSACARSCGVCVYVSCLYLVVWCVCMCPVSTWWCGVCVSCLYLVVWCVCVLSLPGGVVCVCPVSTWWCGVYVSCLYLVVWCVCPVSTWWCGVCVSCLYLVVCVCPVSTWWCVCVLSLPGGVCVYCLYLVVCVLSLPLCSPLHGGRQTPVVVHSCVVHCHCLLCCSVSLSVATVVLFIVTVC